jgi:membrane associated rhomboid family serine protease
MSSILYREESNTFVVGRIERSFRETPVTKILILCFIAVLWYEVYISVELGAAALKTFIEQYSSSRGALLSGRYYVAVTSIFLHAGLAHMGSNAAVLYLAGKPLERHVGSVKFALIFFLSSFVGGIAHAAASNVPGIGASGGVSGVIVAAALLMPASSLLNEIPLIRIFSIPVVRSLFSIVILGVYWIVQESLMTALKFMDIVQNSVGHTAHFGGIVAGAFLAYFLYPHEAVEGVKVSLAVLILLPGLIYFPLLSQLWLLNAGLLIGLLVYVERKHSLDRHSI